MEVSDDVKLTAKKNRKVKLHPDLYIAFLIANC